MYGFEAIIFDVDGTLADTERDGHRLAFNMAFAELGLDWMWSEDLYGELLAVTGGKERIRYYIEQSRPESAARDGLIDFVADLHRRKTYHYLEMLRSGRIPLRAGVMRLLRQARAAGIRLAVATTTTAENVTTLLRCSGGGDVPGWLEVVAAGDMVRDKKPAPDIYDLALDALGLQANACVAVEDSANGVRAALAAGIRALLVTVNDYTKDEDFTGAALVTDGLGEPDSPVRVLQGSVENADYIDLGVLGAMHRMVFAKG